MRIITENRLGYYAVFYIRENSTDESIIDDVRNGNTYIDYKFRDFEDGQVVIDIGAHIGSFAIECALRKAKVIAFEPDPESYKLLLKNIDDNDLKDRITPFNKAVSNKNGTINLYIDEINYGSNSIFEKYVDHPGKTSIKIEAVAINDILKDYDKVTLLKLDCEGAEYDIIQSSKLSNVDKIVMELHEKSKHGELTQYLLNLGFGTKGQFGRRLGKIEAERIKPLKTISLSCNERPEILKQSLDSLKNQTVNLKDYKLYINCEPGNEEVIKLIKDIDFIKTDIVINEKKLGINGNTYAPIKRAFNNADFNLYWEDDIILCPDALSMMEWYTTIDLKGISALLLCNLWDKSAKLDESLVYKSRRFCGWGFVASRHQFEQYFEPAWFAGSGCWDNSSARHIRTFDKLYNIVPQLSRSTNIGKVGTHRTGMNESSWNKQMGGHKYNIERKSFNYYLRDKPEYE